MAMRILVIGAGGVGGYFGGRLMQAGRDVTFLVREKTAAKLRTDGLRIVSPHGNATLEPKVVLKNEIAGPYDVILLSVKAYGLEQAIEDFAPAVGPETMILPMLNGMKHMDLLIARYGEHAVVGGLCMVATQIGKDGEIVQLNTIQNMAYGELTSGTSDRLKALDVEMQGAGFEARLSETVLLDMWEKWVHMSSLGATTCLLRGAVGEIVAVAGGDETAEAILAESVSVATASGYAPRGAKLVQLRGILTETGAKTTSSMYRDLVNNGPVEVDQILGDMLVRAKKLGVTTPLIRAAFVNLSVYQARLQG